MNEFLEQAREFGAGFVARFREIPRTIQIALAVIVLVFFGVFSWFLFQKSTPVYVNLFQDPLQLVRANEIIEKLKSDGYAYKTSDGGRKILVKASQMTVITLGLAGSKLLPSENRVGWHDLIDKRSMLAGMTKSEFRLAFIRGLQTELENGIRQMENIANAKVYITKPQDALFKEEQKPTTATIILEAKPGREFANEQIHAIRNLMKGAVEGLNVENITIVDTIGRDLTKAIEDEIEKTEQEDIDWKYQLQKRKERDLQNEVKTMLDRMLGHNKTTVRVHLELDFNALEGKRHRFVPLEGKTHGVLVSMKTESEEFEGENFKTSGEPGVTSNTPPGAPSYPADKDPGKDRYARDAVIENYDNSTVKETFKKNLGTISQLSMSVVCDWEGNEERKEKLAKIIKNAVGFNKNRGDTFSFMTYPFSRDQQIKMRADVEAQKSEERLVLYATLVLFLLFPFAILIIYLILRAVKQKELQKAQMAEKRRREEEAKKQAEEEARRQEALFPEAIADPEKQRTIQKLRLKALRYASQSDSLPDDFDMLTPEEQELYNWAFRQKADGNIDKEIAKHERIIGDMDRAIRESREFDLAELEKKAEEKKSLEERIKDIFEGRPDDVAKVLRIWLEED